MNDPIYTHVLAGRDPLFVLIYCVIDGLLITLTCSIRYDSPSMQTLPALLIYSSE